MNKQTPESMDFATFLLDLNYGEVNAALSEKLSKVIAAVNDTGKAGSMTVKFVVKKEGMTATVHADAAVKLPEPAMPATMFFFVPENNGVLCREDPRQLTLRELAMPSPSLRNVIADDE